MRKKFVFVCLSILALTGCASMFADQECVDGNWRAVGRRDGGEGTFLATSWKTRCEEHGMKVDQSAYQTGFREGIAEIYCTPEKARSIGASGRGFDFAQCPQRRDLKPAHAQGMKQYCTPQSAYDAGGRQAQFNFDICGQAASDLREAFNNGLKEVYCRPSRAYQAGLDDRRLDFSACSGTATTAFGLGVEVRKYNRELRELSEKIHRLRDKEKDGKLKESERHQLHWEIESLENQRNHVTKIRDMQESMGRSM